MNTSLPSSIPNFIQSDSADFGAFARHLQDAALFIQGQAASATTSYKDVGVLIIRWENDAYNVQDSMDLESVFHHQFGYRIEPCTIPLVQNPFAKLGTQVASFLDRKPGSLLIVYYSGYSYQDQSGQLYWARYVKQQMIFKVKPEPSKLTCSSDTREDAARIKWDGLRCLFDEAQSDMLLLLDSCFPYHTPATSNHGIKQLIAAHSPDAAAPKDVPPAMTPYLLDALQRVGSQAFTAEALFREIYRSMRERYPDLSGPVFSQLTSGSHQDLILTPLDRHHKDGTPEEENLIDGETARKLALGETRVLVCTTFVGDSSPNMEHFHHWLQRTPSPSKIKIESMFLGPPTILIISMPHSVWEVIQHDNVCRFLGQITSSNLINVYDKVIENTSTPFPVKTRQDSAEMQEAAEQLKALSHVRHSPPSNAPARGTLASILSPVTIDGRFPVEVRNSSLVSGNHIPSNSVSNSSSSVSATTAASNNITNIHTQNDVTLPPLGFAASDPSLNRKPRPRQPSKADVSCTHCSHAPFRDASSLRKHIAAAHTRPFPCAFSFAGCTSTFGSKNEWKRHIGSQHLCLQYYRCSACPSTTADGKGNEFNRKDLFTQHLRRMHAPVDVKRSLPHEPQEEWEAHVRAMQDSCLVTRRQPPQKSACPKEECKIVFEGRRAWDEWTEHVGRHMEKGQTDGLGVDRLLVEWSLREGIVEGTEGNYRLVGVSDKGADKMSFSNDKEEGSQTLHDGRAWGRD